MTRKAGISDQGQIFNSSGDNITQEFDKITSISYSSNRNTSQEYDVNSGRQPGYIRDGASEHTGSIEISTSSFQFLKVFGSDDGAGNITLEDSLPEFDLIIQDTETHTVDIDDFKVGRAEIRYSRGGELDVTLDYRGKTFTRTSQTISEAKNTTKPLQWDELVTKVNGVTVGIVDQMRVTYDRQTAQVTDVGSDSKDPSFIYGGRLVLDFTLTLDADETEPITNFVNRSDVDIVIEDTGSNTGITLDSARFGELSGGLEDNDDLRQHELPGRALGLKNVTY